MEPSKISAKPGPNQESAPREPSKEETVAQEALSCIPGHASMNEMPTASRVTEKPKTTINEDPRESHRKPNRLFLDPGPIDLPNHKPPPPPDQPFFSPSPPSRVTEKPKTTINEDPRESHRKPDRLFQFDLGPIGLPNHKSPSSSNDGSWFSPLRYDDDD